MTAFSEGCLTPRNGCSVGSAGRPHAMTLRRRGASPASEMEPGARHKVEDRQIRIAVSYWDVTPATAGL